MTTEKTFNRDYDTATKRHAAVDEMQKTAQQAMQNAGENVREWVENTKTRSVDMYKQAEEQITTHPISSVAVAFGVGFVCALLVKR